MTYPTVRLHRSYENPQDDFMFMDLIVIIIIIASGHAVIHVVQSEMQRIKPQAKCVVYWPNIGADSEGYVRIEDVQQHRKFQ